MNVGVIHKYLILDDDDGIVNYMEELWRLLFWIQ